MGYLSSKKILLPVLLLICFVASCALHFTRPNSQEALSKRVRLLWEARVAGDRESVYALADTKFQKEMTAKQFTKRKGLSINKFNILKVEVNENGKEGFAQVSFVTIKFAVPFSPTIKEKWVFEDGLWRIKLSDQKTPFDK